MSNAFKFAGRYRFDGADYNHERDSDRLTGQIKRVFAAIKDGEWRTVFEISRDTGDPQTSVSAQLRNLRKARYGAWNIECRYAGNGLYEYRLAPGQANEEKR